MIGPSIAGLTARPDPNTTDNPRHRLLYKQWVTGEWLGRENGSSTEQKNWDWRKRTCKVACD
jgi:hypothetical protein